MSEVKTGQLWQRKNDGAIIAIEEAYPPSNLVFSLSSSRHSYITDEGLQKRYVLIEEPSVPAIPALDREVLGGDK